MEDIVKIPRKIWIVIGVVLLLLVIASYSQGKANGLSKCRTL